jgi:hypothetical protein
MSRIYFHSEHEETEVRGWERAMAGGICTDLLAVSLRIDEELFSSRPSPLRQVVDGYIRNTPKEQFERTFRAWLGGGGITGDGFILGGGKRAETFTAALNTALVMGSDVVKLMARLHGQCEIHCYVEGPNRAWLADIIERGRKAGLFRADSGWEETIAMLRSRDDGPVITSYSECDQFPNPGAAQWTPPEDEEGEKNWDAWYEMSWEERWKLAVEGLRSGSMDHGLEMRPDDWADFHFRDGVTGFNIRAYADSLVKDEQ